MGQQTSNFQSKHPFNGLFFTIHCLFIFLLNDLVHADIGGDWPATQARTDSGYAAKSHTPFQATIETPSAGRALDITPITIQEACLHTDADPLTNREDRSRYFDQHTSRFEYFFTPLLAII